MSYAITARESDQILAALKDGRPVYEIAARFGRSQTTIDKMRGKNKMAAERILWTPEEDALVAEMRSRGKGSGQIAARLNRTAHAVAARERYLHYGKIR